MFTMKFTWAAFAAVYALTLSFADASTFLRDVVRGQEKINKQNVVEDALLAKALPLAEYKAKLRAQGLDFPTESRHLEDGGDEDEADEADGDEDDEDADDYFMSEDNMYSFSGYSMKYAKCQPVQRFSEDAIQAGEYTPMVRNDVVILRLCPQRSCSSSRTFGCHYNYAEYAIDLGDYVRIMLRYRMDRNEQLCDWCDSCYARRQLEEDADGDEAEAGDDAAAANATDDDGSYNWWANDDNGDDMYYSDDACYSYKTYCFDTDGYSVCDEDNGDDDDTYIATEDYFDYLGCTQVRDSEDYSYYVQPRCDGYKETIKMAVYYDKFCSQYAGNDVSLKNFGLGFQDSFFEEFYSDAACLDCSESVSFTVFGFLKVCSSSPGCP